MYSPGWISNINKSDILPPLKVKKKVRESKDWQQAVMDSFEHIGLTQYRENLKFYDYYRMVDGKMSYQELSDAVPHLKDMEDLLDGVGIPTFLKHYDIIGTLVNALVGKLIDMQDKYHVVDSSEVAQNEYLRQRSEEIQGHLKQVIDNEIQLHMAQEGLTPEGQQFQSQEEQQAFMQRLEDRKQELIPKGTERASKSSFKNIGMKWGESTLEQDRERFNFNKLEKREFKDFLLSGRCFREHKMYGDRYAPKSWSPKNTFHSKEIETGRVQDGEYVGRIHYYTPAEVIKQYGNHIGTNKQKDLLGGNESWKTFIGDGVISGTIQQAVQSNFNKPVTQPFSGFYDYNFMLGLQDDLGLPMGTETRFNKDGTQETGDRFLPRYVNDSHGRYTSMANVLRDDFINREDLCQVTEVYFRGYYLHGFLTYENDYGRLETVEVTEDILPEFIKENNIKQKYTESLNEIVEDFEANTLKWVWRPMTFEGVKIQSGNLEKPMYLYCKPCDLQIEGDSVADTLLPVSGYIGTGVAEKIDPFQIQYNFAMNQIYSLLEKELGMFFLMDTSMIPSEFGEWGNAEEALVHLRNIAKDVGILPVSTGGDAQRNNSNFNQFSTYNISYTNEINTRIQLAEFFQRKAYEIIGLNPQILTQPSKYETAEGVKISNEASFAQVSELYEDFNLFLKGTMEIHLSVAQFAQATNQDITLFYTKSDGSIAYLKEVDPDFPLRRMGLVVSSDSRKRKELETFKNLLLNNNTLGSDTLELAKLIGSDSMSEVVEIARIAQEKAMEMREAERQHEQQVLAQKSEAEKEKAIQAWKLKETSNQKDRENNLNRERIKAIGRAADKESDQASFREIDREADEAIAKENELNAKTMLEAKKLKIQEDSNETNRKIKLEELKLKAKELEEKVKERKNSRYIAQINKN